MITGFHTIIYSTDAPKTREFLSEVLGWNSLDAGDGWLIFKTPPSEMGVHPASEDPTEGWSEVPYHQSSLMCDDIEATIAELKAKGAKVNDEVVDQGFGLCSALEVPGAGWMMLYQPRHDLAHQLPD